MLDDRQRERRLIQSLRYAAKHEMTVRFIRDRDFPGSAVLSIKGEQGKQTMTMNTLALYKPQRVKAVRQNGNGRAK